MTSSSDAPLGATAGPQAFVALGLDARLAQAAWDGGWASPTPVQLQALPLALAGLDLLAQAPTGSGKTGAFLLPLLQRLLADPGLATERPRRLRALVLAPTRELAAQIQVQAQQLAARAVPGLRQVLAVGGLSINPQMMALRGGAHLLVATPGRLLDLLAHRALRLDDVQCLVLDEADRLLDLGFADELGRLLPLLPAQRQTGLFSATLSDAVQALATQWLRPQQTRRVAVTPAPRPAGDVAADDAADYAADNSAATETANASPPALAPGLRQRALVVDTARRTALLRQLLQAEGWPRVLVFVATQYASAHVADKLVRAGVRAAALHGQLSSGRRQQALSDLQAGRLQVLVATDLAARGLHIDQLAAVVNFDLPRSSVDHIHRVGRTGRAGAPGVGISFIAADAPGSEAHFRLIEKRQQQRVPREQWPGLEPQTVLPAVPADAHGGIKGRRQSKKDKLRQAAALAAAPPSARSRR